MFEKKVSTLVSSRGARDPFAILRQMTSELDRAFDDWPSFRFPSFGQRATESIAWSPKIDVFEKDNRLVTRADLPGMKKEDVSVEVTAGHLALSGERKRETEEEKDNFYRSEREYGSFYRAVPLPEGVKLEGARGHQRWRVQPRRQGVRRRPRHVWWAPRCLRTGLRREEARVRQAAKHFVRLLDR